jgi:hypothetical protein
MIAFLLVLFFAVQIGSASIQEVTVECSEHQCFIIVEPQIESADDLSAYVDSAYQRLLAADREQDAYAVVTFCSPLSINELEMLLPYDEHHSATVRYLDRSGNDEILNYPLNYDEISDRDWLSLEDRDAEVFVSASLTTSVAELIRLAEDARVLCVDPGPLHLLDDYKNAGMILNQDIYLDYGSYATAKLDEDDVRPESFALKQNYPNPFNPQTEISYSLEEESEVSLVIYNVVGQKVITLVEEKQQAGNHTIRFDGLDQDGREVASGMYFYRLTVDGVSKSRKMILMK